MIASVPVAIIPALMLMAATASAKVESCDLALGETVPDAATAIRIAEAVVAKRQSSRQRRSYQFKAEPADAHWEVYQSLRGNFRRLPGGGFHVIHGGGGIAMHIDRCTGAISEMHYQR